MIYFSLQCIVTFMLMMAVEDVDGQVGYVIGRAEQARLLE